MEVQKIRRSWIIVPACKTDLLIRAAQSRPDVIVLDLVELVAEEEKPVAREKFEAALGIAAAGDSEIFAQIDPQLAYDDLHACIRPGLSGVVISRSESTRTIGKIDALINRLESERGIAPGSIELVPALETAPGNHDAYDIARASERISGITLGRADLIMDLRPEPSGELHLMPYLMQRLIMIARAAKVVPIGAWWRGPDRGLLATPDSTYQAALRGRTLGFKGAMCLRPDQVEALNRGYTPADAEVEIAQRNLSAFESALRRGQAGAWLNDELIDVGAARRARGLLALAGACRERDAKASTQTGRMK